MEQHVAVAIVGGGPAGIGAALGLHRMGVNPVLLLERRGELGGIPARYREKPDGVPTFLASPLGPVVFGEVFAERLRARLSDTGTRTWLDSQVIEIESEARRLAVVGPEFGKVLVTADAVILACGARERTPAEKGVLAGVRSSRILFTKNLVDWLDRHGHLPAKRPVILGSDVLAYAAAAKLRAAGAARPTVVDLRSRPLASVWERLYFRRWARPAWRGAAERLEIGGRRRADTVRIDGLDELECDGVVLSAGLVPNSELAMAGGLAIDRVSRELVVARNGRLSHPGWFAAGGIVGGFHGAHWCYRHGMRVAKAVAAYLQRQTGTH